MERFEKMAPAAVAEKIVVPVYSERQLPSVDALMSASERLADQLEDSFNPSQLHEITH